MTKSFMYLKKSFTAVLMVFAIASCKTNATLNGISRAGTTILTCVTDSTAFFNPNVVKLSLKWIGNNETCANRPAFAFPYEDWPTNVDLWFDSKRFYVSTNKKYITNKKGLVDRIEYVPIYGKMDYNARKEILSLSIKDRNWKQRYKLQYDQADSLITLIPVP